MSLLYTWMRNTGLPVTVSVSELAESRCLTFLLIFFFLNSSYCCRTNGPKKRKKIKEKKRKKVSHAALITFKSILLHRPVEVSGTVNESI